MKMNKYQKQLSISLPMTIISLLLIYFTSPFDLIGLIFILPLSIGVYWTIVVVTMLISGSSFGKWLFEDDK